MNYSKIKSSGETEERQMAQYCEQIKGEVVTSVLNWLSMYLAAEHEDKLNIDNDVKHCCECNVKRRSEGSLNSSRSLPFSPVTDLSPNMDNVKNDKSHNQFLHDSNMVLTEYQAAQVWPEWCQHIDILSEPNTENSAANSQVYFDKVNSRLCVYRRGLVEYPSMANLSKNDNAVNSTLKPNLKPIPEIRESLLKDIESQALIHSFANECFIDPHKDFNDINFDGTNNKNSNGKKTNNFVRCFDKGQCYETDDILKPFANTDVDS